MGRAEVPHPGNSLQSREDVVGAGSVSTSGICIPVASLSAALLLVPLLERSAPVLLRRGRRGRSLLAVAAAAATLGVVGALLLFTWRRRVERTLALRKSGESGRVIKITALFLVFSVFTPFVVSIHKFPPKKEWSNSPPRMSALWCDGNAYSSGD